MRRARNHAKGQKIAATTHQFCSCYSRARRLIDAQFIFVKHTAIIRHLIAFSSDLLSAWWCFKVTPVRIFTLSCPDSIFEHHSWFKNRCDMSLIWLNLIALISSLLDPYLLFLTDISVLSAACRWSRWPWCLLWKFLPPISLPVAMVDCEHLAMILEQASDSVQRLCVQACSLRSLWWGCRSKPFRCPWICLQWGDDDDNPVCYSAGLFTCFYFPECVL